MLPSAAGPSPGPSPQPCLIASAHNVLVVRPAASLDTSPQTLRPTGRLRGGPSMFLILSAQRHRREALRVFTSRQYSALPQSERASGAGGGEDTDSSMV